MKEKKFTDLGSRLKKIRKTLRLKQDEMADLLDISGCYISNIENGSGNPGVEFFYKISEKFNVSLDYLFHGIGDMFLKNKSPGPEKKFIDEIETTDDLVWLLENSPMFRNMTMGFCAKYLYENEPIIKRNIKSFRARKEGKK